MKKFKFLIVFGIKKRLFKKAFIITNAIIGIALLVLVNLPGIIQYFSSDDELEVKQTMIINESDDQTIDLAEALMGYLNTEYGNYKFEAVTIDLDDKDEFWETDELDIMMVFTGELRKPDVDIYARDKGVEGYLIGQTQAFLNHYQGIEFANYTMVESPIEDADDDAPISEADRMFIEGIFTLVLLPVFFIIIMGTQFLGVDIIEEKSSKAIETVISSVPAQTHFFAKILSIVLFLSIQLLVLFVFSLVGMLIGRIVFPILDVESMSLFAEFTSVIPHWPSLLIFMVLFMILGIIIYLSLAALIASIANAQEDYQQFQAPIIFTLLGGFYIGIFLPMLGADTLIRIAAYIPLFSTLVAPGAYATGVIALWELFVILGVLIIFVLGSLYLIMPIYRVAILSYEETKFFKRIRFYIRKAFSKS